MSRTVARGDYEGYAALYHPDAVLHRAPGEAGWGVETVAVFEIG
ncbi:MAG: hypothetical protein WEA24_15105 [Gemmatimonadota bacterium]